MAEFPRATLGLGRVPTGLSEPSSLLFDRSKLRLSGARRAEATQSQSRLGFKHRHA